MHSFLLITEKNNLFALHIIISGPPYSLVDDPILAESCRAGLDIDLISAACRLREISVFTALWISVDALPRRLQP